MKKVEGQKEVVPSSSSHHTGFDEFIHMALSSEAALWLRQAERSAKMPAKKAAAAIGAH